MTNPRPLHLTVIEGDADRSFTPTRERPVPTLKERGVYVADFLDATGNPIIQAIARDGRAISSIPWLPGLSYDRLVAELWWYLDRVDAMPHIVI